MDLSLINVLFLPSRKLFSRRGITAVEIYKQPRRIFVLLLTLNWLYLCPYYYSYTNRYCPVSSYRLKGPTIADIKTAIQQSIALKPDGTNVILL